jgi:ubiquinone/menaquinone biosynthesis C-methylase UbiE
MAFEEEPHSGTVATNPDLYDLLHFDNLRDVEFYKSLVTEGEEVLECGVGTGRIAIPLAKMGITVHGIDNSPQMLNFLERKLEALPPDVRGRVRFYFADMCDFDLGLVFDLAYIPFMTFNYLMDIESQIKCLRSIRRHLHQGSKLSIELMSFFDEWFRDDGIERLVMKRADENTGGTIEVYRITRYDPSSQVMEHDRLYRFVAPDGNIRSQRKIVLRNRYISPGEARLLLEKAGFAVLEVFGDTRGSAYTKQSQVMNILSVST